MKNTQETNQNLNEKETMTRKNILLFSSQEIKAKIANVKIEIGDWERKISVLEKSLEVYQDFINYDDEELSVWSKRASESAGYRQYEAFKLLESKKNARKDWFLLTEKANEELDRYRPILAEKREFLAFLNFSLVEKEKQEQEKQQQEQAEQKRLQDLALWKSAATKDGKEVIRAETSKALTQVKDKFKALKIKEFDPKKVEEKVKRRAEEATRIILDSSTFSKVFDFSTIRNEYRNKLSEGMAITAKKFIREAVSDLEKETEQATELLNQLIEARDEEVKNALVVINDLETLLTEKQNEYSELEAKSEEQVRNLQKEITKLNSQIAEIKKKEQHHANLYQNELNKHLEQERAGKQKTKLVMNNETQELQATIRKLEEEKSKMVLSADFFQKQAEQRELELKDLKDTLESEKIRLANIINAKQDELQRKITIFLNKENQLNATIREKNELIKDKNAEINKLLARPDEQQKKIIKLTTKNETLTNEKTRLEEIETKYKQLTKKSWWNKTCDYLGITAMKNAVANITMIGIICGIIYGFSLILKHVIRPTYNNLKSLRSKKEPEPNNENPNQPTAPAPQQPIQQQPIYIQQPPIYQQPPQATVIKEVIREIPVNVIEEKKPPKLEPQTPKLEEKAEPETEPEKETG